MYGHEKSAHLERRRLEHLIEQSVARESVAVLTVGEPQRINVSDHLVMALIEVGGRRQNRLYQVQSDSIWSINRHWFPLIDEALYWSMSITPKLVLPLEVTPHRVVYNGLCGTDGTTCLGIVECDEVGGDYQGWLWYSHERKKATAA